VSLSFKCPSCVPQVESSTRDHVKENTEFKPTEEDSTPPGMADSAEAVAEQRTKLLEILLFSNKQ